MVILLWLQQHKRKNTQDRMASYEDVGSATPEQGNGTLQAQCRPFVTHRSVCNYLYSTIQLPVVQQAALALPILPSSQII